MTNTNQGEVLEHREFVYIVHVPGESIIEICTSMEDASHEVYKLLDRTNKKHGDTVITERRELKENQSPRKIETAEAAEIDSMRKIVEEKVRREEVNHPITTKKEAKQ